MAKTSAHRGSGIENRSTRRPSVRGSRAEDSPRARARAEAEASENGAGAAAPARAARKRPSSAKLPKVIAGAVAAAQDKKAEDLVVLDLRKAGGFTDYFVIATGANARQIGAIADAIQETLRKEYGERPALAEGVDKSEWILLDYFNFVVHVFSRECRAFYGLERLWGNAVRHVIPSDAPLRTT